jgi:hypothetical protein
MSQMRHVAYETWVRKRAEHMLSEWAIITRDRDSRVCAAAAAGFSKQRVHRITGIGRSTIDRILAGIPGAECASSVPDRGQDDH